MGHLEVNQVSYALADGRPLLDEVTFRVGDGVTAALIGPNGTGKTTLLRIIAGDLDAQGGAVTRAGGLGVMPQFIGTARDRTSVRDLLVSAAPPAVRIAAGELAASEVVMMEVDDEPAQLRYAQALADWGDAGGYQAETLWDVCTTATLGVSFQRAQWRELRTLSGGEQKRLVLEALLRGSDDVLLLDEPDNYLDVPAKRWLEEQLAQTPKTVLLVSHDRELLNRSARRIVTLEPRAAGASAWVHGGGFGSYQQARAERNSRLEELRRRWDEDHAKLKALVLMYKQKAAYNDGLASRYQAALTRMRRFEQAGPPEAVPVQQRVTMRLRGGRTGKRAVICERLRLTWPGAPAGPAGDPDTAGMRAMQPFDAELWFGDRVAVLGSNGSGKSHFLRLLAAGGSDPDLEHRPVDDVPVEPVAHTGLARLGARVRPGWFAQTPARLEPEGRTLLQVLHRGTPHRAGMAREEASRVLDRYELARSAEQPVDSLSGGQQARFDILLLELSGATLLLLDEPTDNLDLHSAEALEAGLAAFEGTVVAVTHDRWFARSFDRFLVFGGDGSVYESDEPVWDEKRVQPAR